MSMLHEKIGFHATTYQLFVIFKSLLGEAHIFTVGEAVRSTCGNSHEEKEEEKGESFPPIPPSNHQTI